ncbi:MAG: anthranilate synthase component I family protein [Marinobacter sp.]|nr:anthranilate synthase component I family protein [Marinobacter sp.]
MQSSPDHLDIPQAQLPALLQRLSNAEGFVTLAHSPDHFRCSAWPSTQWQLPAAATDLQAWLAEIEACHGALRSPGSAAPIGGVAGYLRYEAGQHCVPGYRSRRATSAGHLGELGLYHWQLDYQPSLGGRLAFHPACPPTLKARVLACVQAPAAAAPEPFRLTQVFTPCQPADDYRNGVRRILDLIAAGDCYQVNLSQKFTGSYRGSPFTAWQHLLEQIPVPHGGFYQGGEQQVLSISPELFLAISNGSVISKPIKGTRPRSTDPQQDQALAEELVQNPKDRAENLMIVDLIRNDLSHFCKPFSVKVPTLFAIESYRNVHQLVSTVCGELRPEVSPLAALVSAFPGGSITGAPKRRAMEVIDSLEPHERGPYCGSLLWWGSDGNLTSTIAIRTLMTDSNGTISCWGGCGIVADSDPEEEYQESLTKVGRLMRSLETFRG